MTSSEPPPGLEGGDEGGWSGEAVKMRPGTLSPFRDGIISRNLKNISHLGKKEIPSTQEWFGMGYVSPPPRRIIFTLVGFVLEEAAKSPTIFFVGCMAWDSFLTHTKNNWRGKIFKQMRRGQAAFENTCSFWHCCWFSINSDSRCHMFFLGRFNVGTPKLLRTVQVWFPPKSNIDTQIWWVFKHVSPFNYGYFWVCMLVFGGVDFAIWSGHFPWIQQISLEDFEFDQVGRISFTQLDECRMHKYEMAKATKDAWLEFWEGKMAGGFQQKRCNLPPYPPPKKGWVPDSFSICFFILVVENSAVDFWGFSFFRLPRLGWSTQCWNM